MKQTGIMLAAALVLAACAAAQAQQAGPYFTGDGGKGIRLAVLEPAGKELSEDERWMLSVVQNVIYMDFNKYSGMTLIDKQNIEKVFDEWEQSMSGNYSDADRVKIGNLTNASHILSGTVIKTPNAFMLELSVTDLQSGERKASYSQPTSTAALENHSAIKTASAELLKQLGVNLTSAALGELKKAANITRIQADEALARGIIAKRQGTEVAALSYFFQAAIFDPSLAEAVNRSSVMAANISSGNIGADARNDILWRKAWVERLTEAEKYFDNLNKTVSMPYTLFYSDEIIRGDIDYKNESMSLTIKTNLHGNNGIRVWALSVERALQAVCDGLEATKRKEAWGLSNWPNQGVTDLNPFTRQHRTFNIVAELVNSGNNVIGRQEFQVGGYWEYNLYGRISVDVSAAGRKDVRFTNVRANDITDNLIIRFASVNGEAAESAARKGMLQIKAMQKSKFDANDRFTFAFGEITGYKGSGGNLVIPDNIWEERVTSIGIEAFRSKSLTGVTIPNSVTSIGERAFAYNDLTTITIGAITSLGKNAFDRDFQVGRKAGTYSYFEGFKTWKNINELKSIDMVLVKGGTFAFAGEKGRNVTVSDFLIAKYEVTQKIWELVMDSNPSAFKGDNLPVVRVRLYDIQTFISRLNTMTGKKYRLPTEAEWEFAARGGTKSKGYKYSGGNNMGDVAWCWRTSGAHQRPKPVGTKQANELGLHDMSGNVWEWTSNGVYNWVYRGGSSKDACEISQRVTRVVEEDELGFRLALDP